MTRLLKIEWLKLKNYTAFIVLGLFFILGVFASNYIVFAVNKDVVNKASPVSFYLYNFENTWQSTSYITGFILVLPALLLIMLMSNEFSFKTHRQNIIDGLSRRQFISVKLMLAFLFALAATLLVILAALLFGFASGTSFSLQGIKFVGYFFLKALSYNFIAILMAVLIRRTGFAIGVFFIYLGAENIISQLMDLLSMRIKADTQTDLGNMGDYLPMNAADGLLSFPATAFKDMAKPYLPADYTWLVLSLAIVYLVLFYWWCRRKFITTDL